MSRKSLKSTVQMPFSFVIFFSLLWKYDCYLITAAKIFKIMYFRSERASSIDGEVYNFVQMIRI